MSPYLQLAIDETELQAALHVASATAAHIDIIEVGTLLLAAEGVHAVRQLRRAHPEHQIVADLRISRAGGALARLCVDAGASLVTVMAEAPMETLEAAVAACDDGGAEVQIELGDTWSDTELRRWNEAGVRHLIMHRGHEADSVVEGWSSARLDLLSQAADSGFIVSVTGGVSVSEVSCFTGIDVGIFIAGRSIRRAEQPHVAALELRTAIRELCQ